MTKPFNPRMRDRFRKVILVMQSATHEGEKQAAREAASRLAAQHGMSLDEAIVETHPELHGGKVDAREKKARARTAYAAWESATQRMMNIREAQERQRYWEAVEEARQRGLGEREAQPGVKPQARNAKPRNWHSRHTASDEDRQRLITALLKDGLSLRRIAELAEVSTNEVARVYLLSR